MKNIDYNRRGVKHLECYSKGCAECNVDISLGDPNIFQGRGSGETFIFPPNNIA